MSRAAAVQPAVARPLVARAIRAEVLLALVLGAVAAVYLKTLSYGFVYDDIGQIVQNPLITSRGNVPGYFTQHVWEHLYPGAGGNYYRPLFLVWLRTNNALFGLDAAGWHALTLAVHLMACVWVYLLGRRVLEDRIAAVCAVGVFGLHPVHVESVAWISGVTDSMLAALIVPALIAFMKWRGLFAGQNESTHAAQFPARTRRRRGIVLLATSLGLYAAALLVKETALVMPVLVAGCVLTGLDKSSTIRQRAATAFWSVLPFLLVTAVYFSARFLVLRGFSQTITPLPVSTVLLSIPGVLIFYLRLLVWPVGLSPFYDAGYVTSPGLVSFLLPVAGLLLLSGLLVYIGRANARAGLASLLLVLPLLPLLNLTVFAENEYAHDRYLVLPSIGLSLLAGIGVAAVRRRAPGRSALIQIALAGGVCALLATASASQSVYWSSNLALYRRAVSVSPNNDTAQNNLASELLDQGEIDQAIAIYERIVRRNPRYWRASYNLGYAFYKGGMLDEADFHLSRAIELDSGDADEFLYLGLVAMKKGQLDRATSLVQRAIELKGDGRGYHFALGVLMKKRGDIAAAAEQFRQELAKHPDQHAAVLQLAQIESGR